MSQRSTSFVDSYWPIGQFHWSWLDHFERFFWKIGEIEMDFKNKISIYQLRFQTWRILASVQCTLTCVDRRFQSPCFGQFLVRDWWIYWSHDQSCSGRWCTNASKQRMIYRGANHGRIHDPNHHSPPYMQWDKIQPVKQRNFDCFILIVREKSKTKNKPTYWCVRSSPNTSCSGFKRCPSICTNWRSKSKFHSFNTSTLAGALATRLL